MSLGISVYPDLRPMDEIEAYLALAARYGCKRVFSSMFSVAGTPEEVQELFRTFIVKAHSLGMEVCLDVNPKFLATLGVSPGNLSALADIGCDILRMDQSYGPKGDLQLLQNPYGMRIQFNASMGLEAVVEQYLAAGADRARILAGHNFYPQRYTGLKWQKFLDTNEKIKKTGIRIEAFISSHAANTHGVWDARDGLPTVEKMRDLPIDLQYRMLMATGNVDDVSIGNAYASEEEFQSLQQVMAPVVLDENNPMVKMIRGIGMDGDKLKSPKRLRVIPQPDITPIEREILFHFFPHTDFGDSSEWIWRSRMPRFPYADQTISYRPVAGEYFAPGDVVMVNENYKHYAAEVQIVRAPIRNDGERNLVARLAPFEDEMLALVQDQDVVVFMEA